MFPHFNQGEHFRDTFFKWVIRRTKNPTLSLAHSNFAGVCCFLNQALDSDIRGLAKLRSKETALA